MATVPIEVTAPTARRRARPWVGAACLGALAFGLQWWRWVTFRAGTFDLGVFDQAAWLLSRGRSPVVTVLSWNAFADHTSPVLAAVAVLYRIAPTPAWWFALQAAAVGATWLVLPSTLRALAVPGSARRGLTVAVIASPLMWNAVTFDVHPTTLALPLLLLGLRATCDDDRRLLVVSIVGVMVLRDDLAVLAVALCVIGARSSTWRRGRGAVAAACVLWAVASAAAASAAGVDRFWQQRYGHLGASGTAAALQPWHSVPVALSWLARADVIALALVWVMTFGFLPLLAPRRLAVVGLLGLPLFLADDPNFTTPAYHYGIVYVPFLLWAAAGGIRRLGDARLGSWCAALGAVATVLLWGPWPDGQLRDRGVVAADARAAIALVPAGVPVLADARVAPHLAHRPFVVAPGPRFEPGCRTMRVNGRSVAIPGGGIGAVVLRDPATGRADADLLRRQRDEIEASGCLVGLMRTEVGTMTVWLRPPG